jgi:nucleoside-diphosphate-sugar epimerase
MSEIHMIFGTGPLGQSVMRELLKRGVTVRMANRSGNRPERLPAEVEIIGGDAFNTDFTRQAARGAAVVYQCAQPEYTEWTTKFVPLQNAILEGAAAAGAKLIVGDNLYMYGEVNGPIHEDLPYAATTRKGKVRAEAARQVLAAHQSGKVRAAIGRASDFYGPGVLDSACGERMFLPAVQGKAAEGVGNLDAPHTYSFIDDFGKGLVILGERDEALGQAWHIPNAETVSTRRFIELIFESLGQSVKIKSMGRLMMAIGGLFIPAARESLEMMYEFEKPFVVDSSKFVKAFGNHSTPLQLAIHETVGWYCQHAQAECSALTPVAVPGD